MAQCCPSNTQTFFVPGACCPGVRWTTATVIAIMLLPAAVAEGVHTAHVFTRIGTDPTGDAVYENGLPAYDHNGDIRAVEVYERQDELAIRLVGTNAITGQLSPAAGLVSYASRMEFDLVGDSTRRVAIVADPDFAITVDGKDVTATADLLGPSPASYTVEIPWAVMHPEGPVTGEAWLRDLTVTVDTNHAALGKSEDAFAAEPYRLAGRFQFSTWQDQLFDEGTGPSIAITNDTQHLLYFTDKGLQYRGPAAMTVASQPAGEDRDADYSDIAADDGVFATWRVPGTGAVKLARLGTTWNITDAGAWDDPGNQPTVAAWQDTGYWAIPTADGVAIWRWDGALTRIHSLEGSLPKIVATASGAIVAVARDGGIVVAREAEGWTEATIPHEAASVASLHHNGAFDIAVDATGRIAAAYPSDGALMVGWLEGTAMEVPQGRPFVRAQLEVDGFGNMHVFYGEIDDHEYLVYTVYDHWHIKSLGVGPMADLAVAANSRPAIAAVGYRWDAEETNPDLVRIQDLGYPPAPPDFAALAGSVGPHAGGNASDPDDLGQTAQPIGAASDRSTPVPVVAAIVALAIAAHRRRT